MTAKQALALAAVQLREAGIEDPARDARILLAHAMGIAPDRLTLHLPDEMTVPQARAYDEAIAARLSRQPVSQITGQRLFWGRSFRVTPDTLDPRPDTEALVAEALTQPFARVLDLGTGTGCILLTLLAERPLATGLGTDIAPATLAVAVDNAARLSLSDRAAFLNSDWLAGVRGRFDLITSNPPYIAADEMPGLAPEVRDHEPHRALTDFGDGLGAYRILATATPAHLTPGGRLLLEIGPTQGQAVSALLAAQGFSAIRVLPDMDRRDRVVSAIAP
jgi:release factor glutamine methyltransferase